MRTSQKPLEMITEPEELAAMRHAGRLVALAHKAVREAIRPGINTRELDAIAEAVIRDGGGVPAFKGYHGFPGTVCASPNEVVVHGFPNGRKLQEGDLISIDIGAVFEGHYGDSAWTYAVGDVDDQSRRLLDVTEAALWAAIAKSRAGNRLSEVSGAIEDMAREQGMGSVVDYCGHGIGRILHGKPQVLNYRTGEPGPVLVPGQAIAIEPMFTLGGGEVVVKKDGWTVVTRDGSLAAHFEHTLIVTEGDPEITTLRVD